MIPIYQEPSAWVSLAGIVCISIIGFWMRWTDPEQVNRRRLKRLNRVSREARQ